MQNLVFSLSALFALVPAMLVPFRRAPAGRDAVFWAVLALAVAGPLAWAVVLVAGRWHTDLSTALWVTIAACMVLFAGLCLGTRSAWRLAPLLLPYLVLIAALATLTARGSEPALRGGAPDMLRGGAPDIWIQVHIVVSVLTYALLTLAAVAALAAFLQERALKAKHPTGLTRILPPMAESERLQVRLLAASETVLGAGLLTGMAVLYFERGRLLVLDHKTLLSIATFLVIAALLAAHARTGIRGRRAARTVLAAYLLLTLGYLGVKFVTGILLA